MNRISNSHLLSALRFANSHLLGVGVGCAIVFVVEKLERLLTPVIRDAAALGLDRGGRTNAAKSKALNATSARTPPCVFLFFIFGISVTSFNRTNCEYAAM